MVARHIILFYTNSGFLQKKESRNCFLLSTMSGRGRIRTWDPPDRRSGCATGFLQKKKESRNCFLLSTMSGYQDSNLGPSRSEIGMRYRVATKKRRAEIAFYSPKCRVAAGFEPGTLPIGDRDALPGCYEKKESRNCFLLSSVSGYQDSNLGPPGPKPGALPDCATPR